MTQYTSAAPRPGRRLETQKEGERGGEGSVDIVLGHQSCVLIEPHDAHHRLSGPLISVGTPRCSSCSDRAAPSAASQLQPPGTAVGGRYSCRCARQRHSPLPNAAPTAARKRHRRKRSGRTPGMQARATLGRPLAARPPHPRWRSQAETWAASTLRAAP
eukprot:286129-Rhodomonas_salina.3